MIDRRDNGRQGAERGQDAAANPSALAWLSPALARSMALARRALRHLAGLNFAASWHEIVTEIRRERAVRRIRASGLFDDAFYERQFAQPLEDPLRHFLQHGVYEGRWPHPLIDTGWYLTRNPDVKAAGISPLQHYLLTWSTEGRRPNEFFDPRWYAQNNPDLVAQGVDPLTHYLHTGAARHADPSPDFDTRFYAGQIDASELEGTNALAHYLHSGRADGLVPHRELALRGAPVDDAELHCLKLSEPGGEVALFVTHSPDGRLKPHVRHYLAALARERVDIMLIVAADAPFTDDDEALRALVCGLYIRANAGYDFAAWAHILRANRQIFRARIVYLLNDSLLGPTSEQAFAALMARVRASPGDLVGLTENRERGWHLQSFFLALKNDALSSLALHQFFIDIVALADKDAVIDNYEVKFVPRMQAAGLTAETLFKSPSDLNATVYHWRELLAQGFPFLKVAVAREKTGWREVLAQQGYDVGLADAVLAQPVPAAPLSRGGKAKPLARPAPDRAPKAATRVAFLGPWNYDNGLGVAARGYMTALMQTSLQRNFSPIHRPFEVHAPVGPAVDVRDFVGPADVAILHLNPDAWGRLLVGQQERMVERARKRIGLFVWESRQTPDYFRERLDSCDRVWAPSRFCAEAFRAVTKTPVDVIPHVVALSDRSSSPEERAALRGELGLAAAERVILYTFDASSYLVRKNPVALVRAFALSGLGREGWRLVLKTKFLRAGIADHAELLGACGEVTGVTVLNRPLTSVELHVLTDIADIYASSHCSEGFGLTIAEAMAKGKPVVATDYGGVRDFLTDDVGFPVACSEWRTRRDYGAYRRGTVWGRVDEDDLSAKLIAAASLTPAGRLALGEAARRRIETLLSPRAVASLIEQSLAETI